MSTDISHWRCRSHSIEQKQRSTNEVSVTYNLEIFNSWHTQIIYVILQWIYIFWSFVSIMTHVCLDSSSLFIFQQNVKIWEHQEKRKMNLTSVADIGDRYCRCHYNHPVNYLIRCYCSGCGCFIPRITRIITAQRNIK